MFGIGMGELILILIVGLVLFGAEGIQDIARVFGKIMKEFRKAQASLQDTLDEIDDEKSTKKSKTSNPVSTSNQNPVSSPIETYQPPTQESVRASLEKQKLENQSNQSIKVQSETQFKEEKNLG